MIRLWCELSVNCIYFFQTYNIIYIYTIKNPQTELSLNANVYIYNLWKRLELLRSFETLT